MGKYDDIIEMKHFVSKRYPQMSMRDRAAQFSPFAALTGYDDAIKEAARLTDRKVDLDDDMLQKLDEEMDMVRNSLSRGERIKIHVTYFEKDLKKDGGRYLDLYEEVKRIDEFRNVVVFMDGSVILIKDIMDIKIE